MSLLLLGDLSLRGSIVLLVSTLPDQLWPGKISNWWRRLCWLLVPVAFLLPMTTTYPTPENRIVGLNGYYSSPISHLPTIIDRDFQISGPVQIPIGPFPGTIVFWIGLLWLVGAIVSALLVVIPTWKVHQQWSRKRLSTDPALLDQLEDAKIAAGVTAPIGLIVSGEIATPALLGWLRPRILLPTTFSTRSRNELHAVFLHELGHFKMLDIPLNWLFAGVRVIHWFNPLAWYASLAWMRFIEEAADENAIRWMQEPSGAAYGEILLKTLGQCSGGPPPYGALAIGESTQNLKRRILMIHNYNPQTRRGWLAFAVLLILAALIVLSPTLSAADDPDAAKKDALAAMQAWLGEIDAGSYAKSWSDSAKSFQAAITSDQWVGALVGVRTPLGKVLSRKPASADLQTVTSQTSISTGPHTFLIEQFDSSFENMKYARETVTFEKESDGAWRAAGYYIKPQ
jgi:beta-lactamase regulating signal transducer with metallopeptidase domain